jgi:VWFA-related protein
LTVVSGSSRTTVAQQPPPAPRFQSSVEVTPIDVAVVDDRGKPVDNLAPADFNVRVDGNQRRVVTAEWVPLVTPASIAPAVPPAPEGYTSNESSTGGRLIVIAVDEPNIRFGGAMGIARAANGFIDRLSPADRIAVASFGTGAPATVFTADRARVKAVIARLAGQRHAGRSVDMGHNIGLTEAMSIYKGDRMTLEQVQNRECIANSAGSNAVQIDMCRTQVEMEAQALAQETTHDGDQTIQGLRDLLIGLRAIDAPKTLILISEGFVLTDDAMVLDLGRLAGEARTSLYALRLDNQMFEISEARAPVNPFGDRQTRGEGLEMLAGASRGTLFTVSTAEAPFFARIEAELSGYYLLGVESDPRDRDGKPHAIRVDVPRRGAIVRSRRQILNAPAEARAPRSRRQTVAAALSSPLLNTALPLRVASFSLKGPERDKVQLLIHGDIGTDYPSSRPVSFAYVITDQNGRVVDSQAADARLTPVMNGVPSPLQYTGGASLAPGDYTLKFAVVEGDRVGTVEHPIHATLAEADGVTLSELMVGGPTEPGELLRPTISHTASFGSVHGYVEAYGLKADSVTVKYEIAADAKGPPLVDADVAGRLGGDDRVIFSHVIPVHALPPGSYTLRARVSAAGKPLTTVTRGFEVAPPKVLMTSADGLGAASVDAELFLPVDEPSMAPAFRRDHAVSAGTLQPFLERVPDSVKASFDQGVAFLTAADDAKAEASFKRAIDPDNDSTAGLSYLAAAFAASGHDTEAASAWQTALIEGTELPQIYQWLGDALMRTHDYGEARTILEEAVSKWPSDVRFTKPLAMLYATFGRGREAVRTLERYLSEQLTDRDALYLAVEWLFHVHQAGAVVHNRAEDLKLAQTYFSAYTKAKGPQGALVKQWVDYLGNGGKP